MTALTHLGPGSSLDQDDTVSLGVSERSFAIAFERSYAQKLAKVPAHGEMNISADVWSLTEDVDKYTFPLNRRNTGFAEKWAAARHVSEMPTIHPCRRFRCPLSSIAIIFEPRVTVTAPRSVPRSFHPLCSPPCSDALRRSRRVERHCQSGCAKCPPRSDRPIPQAASA